MERTDAIVIGAGASATRHYPCVIRQYPAALRIAVNRAIKFGVPDYFVCVDDLASRTYEEQAKLAQSCGTKLVTLKRAAHVLATRRVAHFDVFVPDGESPFRGFRLSGLFALQVAAAIAKATTIHLVGMEGYPHPDDGPAYFDGQDTAVPQHKLATKTLSVIEPETQAICEAWPEAEWICHGQPHYTITAPNWRIVDC